ncbi:MAG TPA: hypothetical protein VJP87_13280 [Candidatus Acidoferrales bacterium]|nr:hypothetical protein [Candidatus Acidoferrales bacterium]
MNLVHGIAIVLSAISGIALLIILTGSFQLAPPPGLVVIWIASTLVAAVLWAICRVKHHRMRP